MIVAGYGRRGIPVRSGHDCMWGGMADILALSIIRMTAHRTVISMGVMGSCFIITVIILVLSILERYVAARDFGRVLRPSFDSKGYVLDYMDGSVGNLGYV